MGTIAPPILESTAERYGLLAVAVIVLAVVVLFLFKLYLRVNDALGKAREDSIRALAQASADAAKERAEAAAREEEKAAAFEIRERNLRLEFEKRHAEIAERFAKDLIEHGRVARENENIIRRENAATLDSMSEQTAATAGRTLVTIEKLIDRIATVPKSRGGY